MTESKPRLVVVNGDVCSGSSTIARTLSNQLGYELFDVGQEFRKEIREAPERDVHELSVALNGLVVELITTGKDTIIEGRLVGLQARGFSDILKLLCVAPDDTVIKRYMARENLDSVEEAQYALQERFARDEHMLSGIWGVDRSDIFSPILYDKLLDTSLGKPEELIVPLKDEIF